MQRVPIQQENNDINSQVSSQMRQEPFQLQFIVSKIRKKDSMVVNYQGIIECGQLNFSHSLTLLYSIVAAQHWTLVQGQHTGISQNAVQNNSQLVWNFPFEVTFQSKQPTGWPQMVIVLYGKDLFGRSIAKGYANLHLPVAAGSHQRKVPVFETIPASSGATCCAWLLGYIHELKQPQKVLLQNDGGRQCLQTRTLGHLNLKMQVRRYNFQKLGYQ